MTDDTAKRLMELELFDAICAFGETQRMNARSAQDLFEVKVERDAADAIEQRGAEIERLRAERDGVFDVLNRIESKLTERIDSYHEQAKRTQTTAAKKKLLTRWSEASEIRRLIRKECGESA